MIPRTSARCGWGVYWPVDACAGAPFTTARGRWPVLLLLVRRLQLRDRLHVMLLQWLLLLLPLVPLWLLLLPLLLWLLRLLLQDLLRLACALAPDGI